MKKMNHRYLSVFMLHIRSSFYQILLLFALMTGAEFLLFYRHLQSLHHPSTYEDFIRMDLSSTISDSRIPLVFLIAFVLLTLLLTLSNFERKEKTSYTIRRLCIPEKHYMVLQGIYASLVYLLFLGLQIFLVLIFYFLYKQTFSEISLSNQSLLLFFYSSSFLHSLLPLENILKTVRNIALILALGFACPFQSYTYRRGRKQLLLPALTLFSALFFESELGSFVGDIFLCTVSFVTLLIIGYNLQKRGYDYEH